MTKSDLHAAVDNDMTLQPIPAGAGPVLDEVRQAFRDLAHLVIDRCPESRQLHVSLHDIESASRSAIAAIVCHPDDFIPPMEG